MPNTARKIRENFNENNVLEIPKPANGLVSTQDAEAILGVGERAFRNFDLKPVHKLGRRNFYSLRDVLKLRDQRTIKAAMPQIKKELAETSELALEKLKHMRAKRIGLEIRNAKSLGRLVPLGSVKDNFERVRWSLRRVVEECAHLTRRARIGGDDLDLYYHERRLTSAMQTVEAMDLSLDSATVERIRFGDGYLKERSGF